MLSMTIVINLLPMTSSVNYINDIINPKNDCFCVHTLKMGFQSF